MEKETKRIIKEELLRSVGIGFFVLLVNTFILVGYDLPKNFFSALGIPIFVTFLIFLFLVRKRMETGREFKLKPGTRPYRVFLLILILYSVRLFSSAFRAGNNLHLWAVIVFLWLVAIVYGIREDLKASK